MFSFLIFCNFLLLTNTLGTVGPDLNLRNQSYRYIVSHIMEVIKRLATKLMQFGLMNWIDDDSDSKPVDFDRWFWSDSKSNEKSESTIAISILVRSILIKRSLKRSKILIKRSKKLIKSKFQSNLKQSQT